MKQHILPTLLLLASQLPAQQVPEPCTPGDCYCIYESAMKVWKAGMYELAVNKLNAWKTCDTDKAEYADDLIINIFREVEGLKKAAEDAKAKADSLNRKNEKLINAFYFYEGKYGLTFGNEGFYFIDKNGDDVAKLGKWKQLEQFNYLGMAKGRQEKLNHFIAHGIDPGSPKYQTAPWLSDYSQDYLLDTDGNTYPCAYDVKHLSSEITALNLSWRDLSKIPREALEHSALHILFLDVNDLKEIPPTIGKLKNLSRLYLDHNYLGILPREIGQLKKLSMLYLDNNWLISIPPEISQLENLTYLSLGDNMLGSVDVDKGRERMSLAKRLQKLKTPKMWSYDRQVKKVEALYLDRKESTGLPIEIWNLKNLNYLDLSNNELIALPPEIGKLKNLTSLDLSENKFSSLPESFGELKSLTTLDLHNNQLSSLPESIGGLKSLTSLDLSYNQLSSLPESIGELKSLTSLVLNSNKLSSLPESIGELKRLSSLVLTSNKLSSLPESIGGLKSLTSLVLFENQFSSLPESIGELKSLTELDLSYNQFSSLPEKIVGLKSLTQLYLTGNPLPPNEIEKIRAALPNCRIIFE